MTQTGKKHLSPEFYTCIHYQCNRNHCLLPAVDRSDFPNRLCDSHQFPYLFSDMDSPRNTGNSSILFPKKKIKELRFLKGN